MCLSLSSGHYNFLPSLHTPATSLCTAQLGYSFVSFQWLVLLLHVYELNALSIYTDTFIYIGLFHVFPIPCFTKFVIVVPYMMLFPEFAEFIFVSLIMNSTKTKVLSCTSTLGMQVILN